MFESLIGPTFYLITYKSDMTMNVLFKKIFSIEGNIGAGKTTLLQLLEKQIPNCKVIYVSYESVFPVDIDSFCQDLIMNELFL